MGKRPEKRMSAKGLTNIAWTKARTESLSHSID